MVHYPHRQNPFSPYLPLPRWQVDRGTFALWAEILKAVPDAHFWMQHPPVVAQRNLEAFFRSLGVASGRLEVTEKSPWDKHLVAKGRADLVLDSIRVNGHTTTTDTLWAGVPVVTLPGEMMDNRVAASVCQAVLGTGEMLVRNREDYVEVATRLASSPPALARLRAKLRAARALAPLFNTAVWVQAFERAIMMRWATLEADAHRPLAAHTPENDSPPPSAPSPARWNIIVASADRL